MANSLYDTYSAASKSDGPTATGGDADAIRAQKLKEQWNLFVDFAEKRGLKGHSDLDKGVGADNNGIKLVKEFQAANPGTLITPENIPEIQKHLQNYRDYSINKLRTDPLHNQIVDSKNPKGRPVLPNENLDYYMKDLSKIDGIPGSRTTAYRFPTDFLTTIYKGSGDKVEKTETINRGLATMNP